MIKGGGGGKEVDAEIKNLLIDLVRAHPAFYDKGHGDHFRANIRNEIWDQIGKILDVPGEFFYFHCVISCRYFKINL